MASELKQMGVSLSEDLINKTTTYCKKISCNKN